MKLFKTGSEALNLKENPEPGSETEYPDCPWCEYPEIRPEKIWNMKNREIKLYKCPLCELEFRQWKEKTKQQ